MRTAARVLILGRPRFFFRIDQVLLQAEHWRRRPPNRRTLHPQHGDFACRATIHANHHPRGGPLRRKTSLWPEQLQQNFFTHPRIATLETDSPNHPIGSRRSLGAALCSIVMAPFEVIVSRVGIAQCGMRWGRCGLRMLEGRRNARFRRGL